MAHDNEETGKGIKEFSIPGVRQGSFFYKTISLTDYNQVFRIQVFHYQGNHVANELMKFTISHIL